MDVNSSFINGTLEEEVYLEQLEGFKLTENQDYVCKLKKVLYGLKQAPRACFSRIDNYLQQQGYKRGTTDNKLCIKIEEQNMIVVVVYVDDIIFGSNLTILRKRFVTKMQKEFEMSMLGELTFFLGLQVTQKNKGIFISQTKYIKEMLKKFQMGDCKSVSTPMVTGCKLSLDDDLPKVDQTMYRSMVGSLLYETTTRPDIIQAVGIIRRFQSAPKETHLKEVKRIFKYLRATLDFGLWYPKIKDFTLNMDMGSITSGGERNIPSVIVVKGGEK
jgi:hypothetical protein